MSIGEAFRIRDDARRTVHMELVVSKLEGHGTSLRCPKTFIFGEEEQYTLEN
jgi:hypothetical protein